MNDIGDGDRVETGTGVEASGRTQDGNRDGNGDGSGDRNEGEDQRTTQYGNGDGSGDGTRAVAKVGMETGTGTRIRMVPETGKGSNMGREGGKKECSGFRHIGKKAE